MPLILLSCRARRARYGLPSRAMAFAIRPASFCVMPQCYNIWVTQGEFE